MSKNSTDIKRGKLGSCEFLRQGFKSIRLGSEFFFFNEQMFLMRL